MSNICVIILIHAKCLCFSTFSLFSILQQYQYACMCVYVFVFVCGIRSGFVDRSALNSRHPMPCCSMLQDIRINKKQKQNHKIIARNSIYFWILYVPKGKRNADWIQNTHRIYTICIDQKRGELIMLYEA